MLVTDVQPPHCFKLNQTLIEAKPLGGPRKTTVEGDARRDSRTRSTRQGLAVDFPTT